MPYDSDVALLGTGVAPLVAAVHLLSQGKSVLLLNPDLDFYLEDSELPLDPLLHGPVTLQRLHQSSPEYALSVLRPDFPGAIEYWATHSDPTGFHDRTAPHVRQRGRLWTSSFEANQLWSWEDLEDLFVEASDGGLNPQILEGISAAKKFPGFSTFHSNCRGLFIPKLCDVDLVRYRNGLLEFVRERLGQERAICAVDQIDIIPDGIRFHIKGAPNTARLSKGMLVFWTPRMTNWIINQSKKAEVMPLLPLGIRLWEQWSIACREVSDPTVVGMYGDIAAWSDFEGVPETYSPQKKAQSKTPRLAALRAGPLIPIHEISLPKAGMSWGSSESFAALSNLCLEFMKWDRFSISGLKARAIFEWSNEKSWLISKTSPLVKVIPACDGPLVNVVSASRKACDLLLGEQ